MLGPITVQFRYFDIGAPQIGRTFFVPAMINGRVALKLFGGDFHRMCIPCVDEFGSRQFNVNGFCTLDDRMQIKYVARYVNLGYLHAVNAIAAITHFIASAVVPHLRKVF